MYSHRFATGMASAVAVTLVLGTVFSWASAPVRAVAEATSDAKTVKAATPPAVLGTSTEASLAQKQQELAERRHRVEQMLSAAQATPASSADAETLRRELESVKCYELVCAQHRAELARAVELEAEIQQVQLELHDLRMAGPAENRPYSILVLDDILDRQDADRSRRAILALELTAAKELLQDTRRQHDEAESQRRQRRDVLAAGPDESKRRELTRQLELEQLTCQQLAETVQLRRTEIANKQLEQQVTTLHEQYLSEKHEAMRHDVVFTPAHVQMVFSEMEKLEAELRAQIPPLQARLQELETRVFDAQQKPESSDRVLREAMAEGWQTARQSLQQQIKLVQQRLRDIVLGRQMWNVRFQIHNQQGSPEQRADWATQASDGSEQIRTTRRLLEDESKTLTVEIGRREKQLRVLRHSGTDAVQWVEYQLASMRTLSQMYATHLIQVETFARMLAKLTAALDADLASNRSAHWLSQIRQAVPAAWNYEITSVDDRPITVRKIVAGVLLCLIGVWVSRWLSRVLGKRMLPRLGINDGAAAALGTIAFYILAASFVFLAMDMVNIPLTVFTFLGGAVAIGVGFGSQSILNNFISGLILLAEQPIRVGDLVDIGGLCGNVEKIGARSTRVKTGANLEIIVPNSKFLEGNVTNWTLSDTRMRSVVKVGVAYGSPPCAVDRVLRQAVEESPDILQDIEPIVLFSDFGDNALLFEVHFWLQVRSMMQARRAESDLRHRIDRLMRAADISIAFPQRDIHLDTVKPLEVHVRQLPEPEALGMRRHRAA